MARSPRKKPIYQVGDRVTTPSGKVGVIEDNEYTSIKPYKVRWESGHTQIYSDKDFDNYKYSLEKCSPNSIAAQELAQDSPWQQLSLSNLSLSDSARETSTVTKSSRLDTLASQSSQISENWTAHNRQSKSLQRRHRANHSQSRVKGSELTTNETASQQLSLQLESSSPDSLQLRTCTDCSTVRIDQEPSDSILSGSSQKFTCLGTMRNGLVSPAGILVAPLLDEGCYWLESPGALSTGSTRPPGQSKLEAQLKKIGAIASQEVVNPIFLEDAFEIPLGWTDPLECRTGTALLGEEEKPSEIVSILKSQQLHSPESSTSTTSSPKQSLNDSLEKSSKQTGSLYQYTANRRGKDGVMREYPIVEGRDRDRAIDDDWYWGISYVEKVRGKWRDKSSSIPRWSLSLARRLMREKFPVDITISAAQVKWLWVNEIGEYLIGETKPEACPRLAILSFTDKELFISGPSWGEALPLWRQQRREEIEKAIASQKPFSYLKELCV